MDKEITLDEKLGDIRTAIGVLRDLYDFYEVFLSIKHESENVKEKTDRKLQVLQLSMLEIVEKLTDGVKADLKIPIK